MLLSHFSSVRLCATPYMAALQAPLSLGFSGQEHWSGLPFPSRMHESEKWKWSSSGMSDSSWPKRGALKKLPIPLRLWQDSNLQSSDPKSDILSIRWHGHLWMGYWNLFTGFLGSHRCISIHGWLSNWCFCQGKGWSLLIPPSCLYHLAALYFFPWNYDWICVLQSLLILYL